MSAVYKLSSSHILLLPVYASTSHYTTVLLPVDTPSSHTPIAKLSSSHTTVTCIIQQVHAYIISELKSEMPRLFGREVAKQRLIDELDTVYRRIQSRYGVSAGDFPDINQMRRKLKVRGQRSPSALLPT